MQTAYLTGRPRARNAFAIGLAPPLIGFCGPIVFNVTASILDLYVITLVGSLVQWASIVAFFVFAMRALDDLRRAGDRPALSRWPIFVPLYNIYYWCVVVPGEVREAKKRRGMRMSTSRGGLYFFFPLLALQSDLNDLA